MGQYAHGKRHGYGVYSFPNGDMYSGEYEEDLPQVRRRPASARGCVCARACVCVCVCACACLLLARHGAWAVRVWSWACRAETAPLHPA